jgi:Glucitol operon activator protein (GutM)
MIGLSFVLDKNKRHMYKASQGKVGQARGPTPRLERRTGIGESNGLVAATAAGGGDLVAGADSGDLLSGKALPEGSEPDNARRGRRLRRGRERQGPFRKGVILILVVAEDGRVRKALKMRGATVFARFREAPELSGLHIDELRDEKWGEGNEKGTALAARRAVEQIDRIKKEKVGTL